jgi:hypothetical protein
MSDSNRKLSIDTWRPAFLAGLAFTVLYVLCGYLFGPFHSRGAGAFVALAVPFLFAFPIGWKSDAPDVACIAFAAGFVAPTLFWSALNHAGEDLGPVVATLLMSAVIIPGAVFGIGCATVIKSLRKDGFAWPTPRGYLLLALAMLPLLIIGRLTARMHDSRAIEPVVVTDAQLGVVAQSLPVVSEPDKHGSQQHYLAGVVEFERQNFKIAAREWKTAVKLNPGNADARNGLARLGMGTEK